jgi:hypothetical protein
MIAELSQTPHAIYLRTKWYPANKEKQRATARRYKQEFRRQIDKLKDKPCADCGHKFPPCAMDFDHLSEKGEKLHISLLVGNNQRQRALKEIAKCEVVCANCHRIRTWKRNQYVKGTNGRPTP